MKHTSLRLDEEVLDEIYRQAAQADMKPTVFMRELVKASIKNTSTEVRPMEKTPEGLRLEKVMLKMLLQILGLTRFLVSRIDEAVVQEAIKKSEVVLAHYQMDDEEKEYSE